MAVPLLLLLALVQPAGPAGGAPAPAAAVRGTVRIGDLADVEGIRENALIGTGLVVGLNGTGDSAAATKQALANLLEKYHLNLGPGDVAPGSAALVVVTARLPPFARQGDRLDVTVNATGGAKSLFGGTLLFTPLAAADGRVYGVAQGSVTIGGFQAEGAAASVQQNHPTVGFISGGATVEEDIDTSFLTDDDKRLALRLRRPDFATASRVVDALNEAQEGIAQALDPSTVRIRVPDSLRRDEVVAFVAALTDLRVDPHVRARVVINERTGTIVAGEGVRLRTVAIAHGNLTVTVAESPQVSQPLPESRGVTAVVPRTDLQATVDGGQGLSVVPDTSSIGELAAALNALGATPRDLITILQMLREAGALHADLEIL